MQYSYKGLSIIQSFNLDQKAPKEMKNNKAPGKDGITGNDKIRVENGC